MSLTVLEPSEAEQDELLHVLNKLRALRGPGETRPRRRPRHHVRWPIQSGNGHYYLRLAEGAVVFVKDLREL
jgi:hypothetical protein